MSISTRVLRKFTGDNDLIHNISDEGSDIDDTPFSSGAKKKQLNINRFDLLTQQSQSESEIKEDDDDNEHESKNSSPNPSHMRETAKRKKKKKKKKSYKSNQKQSGDDLNEIERSIQEVNAISGDIIVPVQSKENIAGSSSKKKGILFVEHKHLNPKNELKRIFGPKIIQNEQSSKRKNHGRRILRSIWLVTPRDHWPPITKLGLSMKFLETKNGVQYFTYEHSLNYQSIQKKFLEAVESMYPNNIMSVANQSPYHVDTMIQLSDIFKLSEDLPMAAELIERALFSLESAFHPLFNVTKGNCRLDYRKQENRALYIALFKHLTFVGQRACYRTALEFCKLIYSLDPEKDPLAIVLAIDFYALRSREFDWFLQFIEQLDHERNLSQLPNMVFSKAVALFQLSDPSSSNALQDALLMFPSILIPLLDNCGVQPDPKTQAHEYFNNTSYSRTPALNLLVQLYVNRNYCIWKEPDTLAWLERNTLEVLKRVDNKDPLVLDYAKKRSKRFEAKIPREIQRHVFLSDIKKVTAVLAETSNIETTFSFDPLPPIDSINLYAGTEHSSRMYESSNPITLYIRSLMPDFQAVPLENLPEGLEIEAYDEAARHARLQNSIRDLLNAVRNFFSNLGNEEVFSDTLDSSSDENADNDNFPESSI